MKTMNHSIFHGKKSLWYLGFFSLFLVSCGLQKPSELSPTTMTPSEVVFATRTASQTSTSIPTVSSTIPPSPTETPSPTKTPTPTISPSPSITLTPTNDTPIVTVQMTAHCRYGPGTAYLHAADLYTNDLGKLWNRNYSGTWLWVKFDKLHYACWVAASVASIDGDIFSVVPYFHPLPKSTLYGPVPAVKADRNGNSVAVIWDEVWMTEDDFRGYLIEAQVCQNGFFIDVAYHTEKTSMNILDERTCDQKSNGKLYAVEKHGYTDPIPIPWP